VRLKKELLKMTSSEASFSEAKSSEAKILQTLESIDKVHCTKSTTTMPTPVPATTNSAQYPLYTTRIIETNAETFPYFGGMDLNLISLYKPQIKQRIKVSNQLR